MPRVPVAFVVTSGGGSVTEALDTTNANGIATVGQWIVGKTVGRNTLSVSIGSLEPIIFSAVGSAGAPASVSKSAGDGQSAVAGSAVTSPPAVVIVDANGNAVSGVTVLFAVTGGGGAVSGESVITDSSGVAKVGGWTLGKTSGPNTLTAKSGSLSVEFTATGVAGDAASLTKVAGDNQTAAAATAVSVAPAVAVKDANGNLKSGTTVTFVVASGGGSITGGTTTSNDSGIATVGSWMLGPAAGTNTITASATAKSGSLSVEFTATGVAGDAASLTKVAGDNQTAAAATAVSVAPAVAVKDANGNLKSGTTVTFVVASGGGSITGGTTTSNDSGIATVGSWMLGSTAGTNTITASATGVSPVTFTATAIISDPCLAKTDYAIGVTASGTLASTSCHLSDGSYADFYSFSVPTDNAYLFTQESSSFDTYLLLSRPDGTPIGENDDADPTTSNSAIKVLLPAGSYTLRVGSFEAGATGKYSLSSKTTSSSVTGCESVFVAVGISTEQALESTDCLWADGPIYADAFTIFLKEGQSLEVSMSSVTVDSFLELYEMVSLKQVASNDNRDSSTKDARLTYTAPAAGFFVIIARSAAGSPTGAYTLTLR
jgi:hypothetical protein